MAYNLEKLKAEIQTSQGLLAKVKEKKLPDRKSMAKLALHEIERTNGELTKAFVESNFSPLLKELIRTEYRLYAQYETEIIRNALKVFLDDFFGKTKDYPELQKLFLHLKGSYPQDVSLNFEQYIGHITVDLFPVMRLVIDSASQGAKSRAGGSLENHLENLFTVLEFKFAPQVQISKNARVDFLFPNLSAYKKQPQNCMFLSSQTTLKDRFRLSISQISAISSVRKYIVTATGAGLINLADRNDLTDNKIKEIGDKGFKIIVFDEVKNRYPNNQTIISYSRFVQKEYPAMASLW
jgi:hypothetical protein